MTDLSEKLGRLTQGIKGNFINLAYQRDPYSLYDELLIGKLVILYLSVAFTLALGAYYHYNIFENAFGWAKASAIGSFALLVVIEVAKVFFGLHLCRSFFSGLWFKSLYSFLFMLGIGFIVTVAFQWSINITTKAVGELNRMAKTTEIYMAEDFVAPPSIAEIDKRLSALDAAKEAGARSTWKGRTTKEGIGVIAENTELQKELLSQRSLIMNRAMAQHDSVQAILKAEVGNTSKVISDYGGKAEYATMLMIVLVVLFEFINYEKNKAKEELVTVGKKA